MTEYNLNITNAPLGRIDNLCHSNFPVGFFIGDNMEIQEGYCHCGCGRKTSIPLYNNKNRHIIKNKPMKFINHHYKKYNENDRIICNDEYIKVINRSHPKSSQGKIREHIIIAENILGHQLPPKVVIHHYGNKSENNKLVICENQAYHLLLHARMRSYKACGHATWRKCIYCGKYDNIQNMIYSKSRHYFHKRKNNKCILM